jgi:hypothetical protein
METIKNIFVDSLNGFALSQIPLFIFQLLCAGLLSYVLQLILNKKFKTAVAENGVVTGMGIAVLAAIVKYSVPGSILAAAIVLLFLQDKEKSKLAILGQTLILLIGVGCGLGSVVLTGLGMLVLVATILFIPIKK